MPIVPAEPVGLPEAAPSQLVPTIRFQRKDTEQCHVCLGGLGLPRGDDRRFAARVLDAIFGGLSSSRLFQAVRPPEAAGKAPNGAAS